MTRESMRSRIKMENVAKAAGVSTMTVSRALKKDSPISEKTRARILKIIREMNYVPDLMAGGLSSMKSGFVALLLPSLNNLHFAQTVEALSETLARADLQILLGHTGYSLHKEEELIELMLGRRPEAIVLSYDGHTERARQLLEHSSVPIIEIWDLPDRPIQHTVGFSNFEAAHAMTSTLIRQGYRRLAFLGEADDTGTRGAARRRGFVAAMGAAGLSAHRLVRHKSPPVSIESGAEAAYILLDRYPDTDCIFCVSDPAAFGVLSTLKKTGRCVPKDIAVVGFGNFEVSRFADPPISTVAIDPKAIGRESGNLIADLLGINGKSPKAMDEYLHIPVQYGLEFRESS
ncbi:LacI family DNA-binding transcriptional regulator [Marinobacterium aestuariivivens]|uniref:LacI family DNA-binding transcriptional regulator n=1 Tax=Marinobacterium aestuariivivens TaxID=1698799 RepID=A0ABW2A5R3_9GAMM